MSTTSSHPPTALIVFAKPPVPGAVKTRLTAVLSLEDAARLYRAFLVDALQQYAALPVDVRLYWADTSDATAASRQALEAETGLSGQAQCGDGLGERMHRAFEETFAAGYERTLIIGTDHPTLPTAYLEAALQALDAPETLCIGPSNDGGYYLLGMSAFYPQLFADMRYSHERVLAETLARADQVRARLTVLPSWYDVDTPEDLKRLVSDVTRSSGQTPHTYAVLQEIGLLVMSA